MTELCIRVVMTFYRLLTIYHITNYGRCYSELGYFSLSISLKKKKQYVH